MEKSQGFTLIELLVVIIIIGVLSAIALPSFLGQASKARQSEAKLTIGSALKAQSTYYIENQTFTGDWGEMGLGLYKETSNYKYELLRVEPKGQLTEQIVLASPQKGDMRGYIGGVQVVERNTTPAVISVLCEAKKPGLTQLTEKTVVFGERDIKCGSEAREVR